jgi:hypothetical protein
MLITDINSLPYNVVKSKRIEAFKERTNDFIFPHKLASGKVVNVFVNSRPVEMDGVSYLLSAVDTVTETVGEPKGLHIFRPDYFTSNSNFYEEKKIQGVCYQAVIDAFKVGLVVYYCGEDKEKKLIGFNRTAAKSLSEGDILSSGGEFCPDRLKSYLMKNRDSVSVYTERVTLRGESIGVCSFLAHV